MTEQAGDFQEAVESIKIIDDQQTKDNQLGNDKNEVDFDGDQMTKHQTHSKPSLEQSFHVDKEELNMDFNENGSSNSKNRQQSEEEYHSNKLRSNSGSHSNSFQQRLKKSGSFLASKLQSSQDESHTSSTNIPSSIANAFSTFSSFTSNFSLNNPTSNSDNNSSNGGLTIETASTSTKLSQINETREDVFIKKAALERKNLISLTKLIVKDLISSSLLVSRTIDDCQNAVHLNNYFTLIDRVLKHGLKQNILTSRSASLWNALDSLPKYLKESTLMSESVRSLANTKTHDGKIKAWMRLAMMQKKLPEYFNELLANKNVLLKDIYHDYAFMLNDEAHVFAGLIIGVNVIDCNFFVKDDNFDLMDDIIDLNPYLRIANSYDDDRENSIVDDDSKRTEGLENLTVVLDQKNYLEEWNKRLESIISDLQVKIKSLEDQNSKLEMEAKLSEARILKLQGKQRSEGPEKLSAASSSITDAIKNLIVSTDTTNTSKQTVDKLTEDQEQSQEKLDDHSPESDSKIVTDKDDLSSSEPNSNTTSHPNEHISDSYTQQQQVLIDNELQRRFVEQEKELANLKERSSILEASYRKALDKIRTLEHDLDVQTSMNADKENTIKIYEKDIREKQSQVESLRTSLNDSKKLNSDLSERLNDTTTRLKDRVKTVSNLQASLDKWKLENKTLAARLQDKLTAYKSIANDLEKAVKTVDELKKYNEKINEELKSERVNGQSSSVTVETQNAKIAELTAKVLCLEAELKDVKPYKDQTEQLEKRCQEYELSLEEIGIQLRESRLEVENIKENSAVYLDSQWMDSKQVKNCALCQLSFSVTRRKHHCRLCGNVFCQTCSDNKMELASSAKPVRVCDTCHSFLLAKFVKTSTS